MAVTQAGLFSAGATAVSRTAGSHGLPILIGQCPNFTRARSFQVKASPMNRALIRDRVSRDAHYARGGTRFSRQVTLCRSIKRGTASPAYISSSPPKAPSRPAIW